MTYATSLRELASRSTVFLNSHLLTEGSAIVAIVRADVVASGTPAGVGGAGGACARGKRRPLLNARNVRRVDDEEGGASCAAAPDRVPDVVASPVASGARLMARRSQTRKNTPRHGDP